MNLPQTVGAAFQTAEPPPRARKERNLTKLDNSDIVTNPPNTFTDSQQAE